MLTIVILGPIVSLVSHVSQHTYVTSHADERDLMLLVVEQVSRLRLVMPLSLQSPVLLPRHHAGWIQTPL